MNRALPWWAGPGVLFGWPLLLGCFVPELGTMLRFFIAVVLWPIALISGAGTQEWDPLSGSAGFLLQFWFLSSVVVIMLLRAGLRNNLLILAEMLCMTAALLIAWVGEARVLSAYAGDLPSSSDGWVLTILGVGVGFGLLPFFRPQRAVSSGDEPSIASGESTLLERSHPRP